MYFEIKGLGINGTEWLDFNIQLGVTLKYVFDIYYLSSIETSSNKFGTYICTTNEI